MAAFKNIAFWGAGGDNIGGHLIDTLLKDGSFNVTVITRASSKSTYPAAARVVRVPDTPSEADLVAALEGQDVVISAVGNFGITGQLAVAKAAATAGVRRFVPSEWGFDNADPLNAELLPLFREKDQLAAELTALAAAKPAFTWTGFATGIWLDWALDYAAIDIDPARRTAAYWDEGTHAPSITTRPYAAEAVRQALLHPHLFHNQRVFVEAFAASQRDIVAELERQQGASYETETVDGTAKVRWTAQVLAAGWDDAAVATTVSAELWLPRYKADFVKAGKQPILEHHVHMPKLTLGDVVAGYVAKHKSDV